MKKEILSLSISLIALCGCSNFMSSQTGLQNGSLSFSVQWSKNKLGVKVIPVKTNKINIFITGEGIKDSIAPTIQTIVYPQTTVLVKKIPIGKKTIIAKALDADNNELAKGETEAVVEEDKRTTVTLELKENKIEITQPIATPSPEISPSVTSTPEPIPTPTPEPTPTQTTSPTPTPTPTSSTSIDTVASIILMPEQMMLYQSNSNQIKIILKDKDGKDIFKPITYELDNQGIVSVKILENNVLDITGSNPGNVNLTVKVDNIVSKPATIDVIAQPAAPAPTWWAKTYGGANDDKAISIQPTNDAGYIFAGETVSFGAGNSDILILKLDSKGNAVWQKCYGTSNNDHVRSIQQTQDGGYIMAGWTEPGSDHEAWVIKLDSAGAIEWHKSYSVAGTSYHANEIQQLGNGTYILAGTVKTGTDNVWIIKLNADGTSNWERSFIGNGNDDNDVANSIRQTQDGGYLVAGTTRSYALLDDDVLLMKFDAAGTSEWKRVYIGPNNESADMVRQTSDGGYILSGNIDNNIGILKINSDGTALNWKNTYTGIAPGTITSVQQTQDGGYILTGTIPSAGTKKILVLKFDSTGSLQWQKTYGGTSDNIAASIRQISDGYILGGLTSSFEAVSLDMWGLKLYPDGTCSILGSNAAVVPVNTTINIATMVMDLVTLTTNIQPVTITPVTVNVNIKTQAP